MAKAKSIQEPDYNNGANLPYHNSYNYQDSVKIEDRKEINTEPSQTVQGAAMTTKEIMEKALGGIPETRANLQYFDQPDLDKINEFYRSGFDLTDLDNLSDSVAEMNQVFKQAADAKRKKEEEEAIENRVNEEVIKRTSGSGEQKTEEDAG